MRSGALSHPTSSLSITVRSDSRRWTVRASSRCSAAIRSSLPRIVTVQRRTHVQGATRLHTVDVSAVTSEGNVIEWSAHVVLVLDSAGRDSRQEWFPEDHFPAALARFDELGAAEPADPRHPRAENLAMTFGTAPLGSVRRRADRRTAPAVRRRRRDDRQAVDHRHRLRLGADAIIANLHAVAEFGSVGVRVEPLAVRGSRLGLAPDHSGLRQLRKRVPEPGRARCQRSLFLA